MKWSSTFLPRKIIYLQEAGGLELNYDSSNFTAHGYEHDQLAPSEYDGVRRALNLVYEILWIPAIVIPNTDQMHSIVNPNGHSVAETDGRAQRQ
jgi:hypothetical protein